MESFVCNWLGRPCFVAYHGDVAGDGRLNLTLSQTSFATVVETFKAETLNFGAVVGYRKGAGARSETNRSVGLGFRDDSEGLVCEAWVADTEVHIRDTLVNAHQVSPGECGALKIIILGDLLVNWAFLRFWEIKGLTVALNSVLIAFTGVTMARRPSTELSILICMFL